MKPAIKDRHNVSRARRDPSSVACGIRNPSRDQRSSICSGPDQTPDQQALLEPALTSVICKPGLMKPCNPGQCRDWRTPFRTSSGKTPVQKANQGAQDRLGSPEGKPVLGNFGKRGKRVKRDRTNLLPKPVSPFQGISRFVTYRVFMKLFPSGTKAILDNTCMTKRTFQVPITCAAVPKIGGRRLLRLACAERGPSRDGCRRGVAGGRSI